jgi:hypothetical protein
MWEQGWWEKCDLYTSLFFIFISGVSVKSYCQDFMMQKVNFNVSGLAGYYFRVVCRLIILFFSPSQEKTGVSLLEEKLSQLSPPMQ